MIDLNLAGTGAEEDIDFPSVNAYALSVCESLLRQYQPGGKVVRGEYVCGSIYGGAGDSCATNLTTGVGSDFATGQSWGDLVDLVHQIHDISMSQAALLIRGDHNTSSYQLAPQPSADDKYKEGKATALALWMESVPCPHEHPYLLKKLVPASVDIRLHPPTGNILIPLFDEKNDFWSVQRISEDGTKKVSPNGKMRGNFFTFPGDTDVIYICEGYSTAATVSMVTGKTAVMTVSAGNMKSVAEAICKLHPTAEIVFAADNDNVTPSSTGAVKNPGLTAATQAKKYIGRGRVAAPPTPDETKCDWNDYYIAHGMEATRALLQSSGRTGLRIDAWDIGVYNGVAKEEEWIVEHILPRGKAALLVAAGDTGKGMLTLDLALRVAAGKRDGIDLNPGAGGWFGNPIVGQGRAVIIGAEDDKDEFHRRIERMDPDGSLRAAARGRLYIIPLPNSGGPFPIVVEGKNGVQASEQYYNLLDQLKDIDDLALINFDPLASFVMADINGDPNVGSFTMGLMASLAIETNAAVVVAHHTGKVKEGVIRTPEQARQAIRGTTAIVDGCRVAVTLWGVDEKDSQKICNQIGVVYKRNRVFKGAVVKANGEADREIKTFVRNDAGLLVVRDADIIRTTMKPDEIDGYVLDDIENYAAEGYPLKQKITDSRHLLNPALSSVSDNELINSVTRLLDAGKIVNCRNRRYDITGGPFAAGGAVEMDGAINLHKR